MNDIVLLNLRISMWGVNRTLGTGDYEVDAEKPLVRASKKILDCPEYEYLTRLKRGIHSRLKSLALPAQILRAGVYPVALAMVPDVDAILQRFEVEWQVGVEQLGSVWDMRLLEIQDRLRGLYDERDYPAWERANNCFAVAWSYFTIDTPKSLQAISGKLLQRERAKAAAQWTEMLDEVRDGLRCAFKELIDSLLVKLTPGPDGTKKRLTGVDRLLEFVDTFAKKNVANDAELQTLVEEARGILENRSTEELRTNQRLREYVQDKLQSVKVIVDTMVEDAPARQIVLRD